MNKPRHPCRMYPRPLYSRGRDGTDKEEARRQEDHFCQTGQKDGKRQKAPEVRRHPASEGRDANSDASGVLTTQASGSRQAASA